MWSGLSKIIKFVFSTITHTLLVVSTLNLARCQELSFSCGHLYYRTLHMDGDSLYVGAMDYVFKLNAFNISTNECLRDALHLPATNEANCVSKRKSIDFDCHNHIRVIQPLITGMQDGSIYKRLYVCGTNAHSPKDYVIYGNLSQLARHEFYPGVGDGIAKCPFDPEDNSTAIWIESGNPGGHPAIYSGTNAEFTKADPVLFRGDIFDPLNGKREYSFKRTIKYDSHMLDKPDFVASFDIGSYVYFFFRETAVEVLNCGTEVFSRVARVCKNDMGGKNILKQNWATYLKARLNCSINSSDGGSEVPFFFNEIQDVFKDVDDDSTFHAVFTSGRHGLSGSAICSFRLADIQHTFDAGQFKEQASSTSVWLPVPSARVPIPRPGQCVDDTRKLSDNVLNFIRKHPLLHNSVPHDSFQPNFYERDVVFTKITADNSVIGSVQLAIRHESQQPSNIRNDILFTVFYVGTEDGRVFKVSRYLDAYGRMHSQLLDVFEVTHPHPVRAISFSKSLKSLYVTSDYSVRQISVLSLCNIRYSTNCVVCIRDPYCGWDVINGHCTAAKSDSQGGTRENKILSDARLGGGLNVCRHVHPVKEDVRADYGQSVFLKCPFEDIVQKWSVKSNNNVFKSFWVFQSSDTQRESTTTTLIIDEYVASTIKGIGSNGAAITKYVISSDNGLVIMGVRNTDSGRYSCYVRPSVDSDPSDKRNRILVADYAVEVRKHQCDTLADRQSSGSSAADSEYIRSYAAWCKEYEKYRSALTFWERRQNQCASAEMLLRKASNSVYSNGHYL